MVNTTAADRETVTGADVARCSKRPPTPALFQDRRTRAGPAREPRLCSISGALQLHPDYETDRRCSRRQTHVRSDLHELERRQSWAPPIERPVAACGSATPSRHYGEVR